MGSRGSSAPPDSRKHTSLDLAFRAVRAFVAQADRSLLFVRMKVGCPEISAARRAPGRHGQRAFMHVGHLNGTVCVYPGVEKFASGGLEGYLTGLLLHEFGHLGSGGGERDADQWILDNFGIRIHYKGELDVEWVDGWAMRRIIAHARKGTVDFRHNR